MSRRAASVNPWLIAAAVMSATFMEVLDTTVVNVALPHIAGNLSASTSDATWVLTSYLVANAIVLPATAWFGSFFGRKRFLTVCIVIFTAASGLCGIATSLPMLIGARILQGAAAGRFSRSRRRCSSRAFRRSAGGSRWPCTRSGSSSRPSSAPRSADG